MAECCAPMATEKGEKLVLGRSTCSCSEAGENSTDMRTALENNCVFGNLAIEFCEIFTWPTCKSCKYTVGGIYFLTARVYLTTVMFNV
jgi:hypothetical protein